MTEQPKNDSKILIYKDGEPVEIPVTEFLRMLEEAHV